MEKFLEKLLSKTVLVVLVFILSLTFIWSYFYFNIKKNQTQKAGLLYNQVMSFAITNRINTDLGNFPEKKLKEILPKLIEIYQKYPKNNNGLQSAFTIANIYFELGDYAKAKDYYQIFKKNKKHYLAVNALYSLAICEEAQSNYLESIEILTDLKKEFPEHFLVIDMIFAEARNYILQKDYDLALSLYNELLANEEIAKGSDQAIRRKITEVQLLKKLSSAN